MSAADNNLSSLQNGDIQTLALNANFTHHGYNIHDKTTAASLFAPSDNTPTAVVTQADNKSHTIRYHDSSVVRGNDLGLIEANANGHAVSVIAPAGGNEAILTITANGTAVAVPDVNNIFQVGDIIVSHIDQPNVEKRQYLIIAIDPSNNGRSLSVIGSSSIIAAGDAADSLANFVRARIRHGGPSKIASSVNRARQLTEFEIDWTPRCLSFFRLPHSMPGGAKFQLNMTPKNLYREAAIESLVNKSVGDDYNFQVLSCFLYIPTFEGRPHIDKYQFYLDLNEIRCQKVDITSQETSYTLDVRPSTNALAVATQSSSVDNNTNFSSSKFTSDNDFHRKMTSFHIRYGSEQKPIPDFDMSFDPATGAIGRRDHWNEIYMRNLLASGAYFDSSTESIQEYFERGNYIYQIWNRDGSDRETRVYIKVAYSENPSTDENKNPKLLLWNFYKKYAICSLDNGRYQTIAINEA